MFIEYLAVKIQSLHAEAQIIRKKEQRRQYKRLPVPEGGWPSLEGLTPQQIRLERRRRRARRDVSGDDIFWGLRHHRIFELRKEARCTYLAYAYIRGVAYRDAENDPHWLKRPYSKAMPDLDRVAEMVRKYAPTQLTTMPDGKKKLNVDIRHDLRDWMLVPPMPAQKAA